MNKLFTLLFIVILVPLINAQVAIDSFSANPSKISPGEKLRLTINLENVGNQDISNILVKLDLSQVPFAPLVSSSEQVIDEIEEDEERTLNFDLVALPNAESQIYKIPVEISYNDTKKISLISLEISADAKLDLILDNSDIIKVNDKGKISLKFVNNGLVRIKFLKVTLQENPNYEIISTNSLYIGEVDVDDFESEEFTIIPISVDPYLNFNLEYRDINNQEFKENKSL